MIFGNELNRFLVQQVRENYRKERKAVNAVSTRAEALEYVKQVREKVRSCFNFPKTKCPLNPVITGKTSNDVCNLEKLYFFSRPGYPVTADYFLPKKFKGKIPAVLLVCGHSLNGKAGYQHIGIALAKKGFAVLCIDPLGQGERISLAGKGFSEFPEFNNCCEHNEEGKQLLLTGEWFGAWRAYDGVRAVDYLLTRPEVDPKRICLTGNSGGGTLTTWINAVEDRLCMAAPSCYITTWKNNLENELPADIEQMPPKAFAMGLEMADFLLAAAPRPLLILGQKNDFFDHRGTIDTYQTVKHIYDLLKAPVKHFIGPVGHGYSQHNREAMYEFFTSAVFKKADKPEGDIPVFKEDETWAAPLGNIENLPGNRTFREIAGGIADSLIAKRRKLSGNVLKKKLVDLIKPGETFVPEYRVLRPREKSGWIFSTFALETEPDEVMSILKRKSKDYYFHLQPGLKKIMLYIPHLDAQKELLNLDLSKGYDAVYGLDMRGIGEMMSSGCDQPEDRNFFHRYQAVYHSAAVSLMLDKPLIGQMVHDILCAVELLTQDGAPIDVTASRQGCIPALIAAVLSDKIKHIRLMDGLDSYESLMRVPASWYPLAVMVPDVLRYFDLPDLREAIKAKLVK